MHLALVTPSTPHASHPAVADDLTDMLAALPQFRHRPRRGVRRLRGRSDLWSHPKIASALVDCALELGDVDLAARVVAHVVDPSDLMVAQVRLAQGDADAALAALMDPPKSTIARARYFGVKLRALVLTQDYARALSTAHSWSLEALGAPVPYRTLARALADIDDDRARDWFEYAVFATNGGTGARLDLAEYLIACDAADEARPHLMALTGTTGEAAKRRERLLRAI